MGRIKTRQVKRIGHALMKDHAESLGEDFVKNKLAIDKLLVIHSQKIRNVIAGYVTRLAKIKE
jgi:small subunit ribosomal protein S17e